VPDPQPQEIEPHNIENDVETAIEACGGDSRAAVRALVVANAFLDAECERLRSLTSSGFARGKLSLLDLPLVTLLFASLLPKSRGRNGKQTALRPMIAPMRVGRPQGTFSGRSFSRLNT
jgi:hypothetical protein